MNTLLQNPKKAHMSRVRSTMEKISILSLSLMLISTYAVSAALPAMQEYFSEYSRAEVEQLISITSFAVTFMIIINNWLSKFMSERLSITLGILLIAVGGSAPTLIQQYEIILAMRVLLGIGIGLINSYAINMINERYEGNERASLLGFRSSAEVLGNAVLTLIVGWILPFGWKYSFIVYLAALPILVLYLCFVPKHETSKSSQTQQTSKETVSIRQYLGVLVGNAGLGILLICIHSSNTLRIPGLTLERGLGTDSESSVVLSCMMVTGILAGICFGKLAQILGDMLMCFTVFAMAAGMAVITFSNHIIILAIGAMIAGMAYNILVTELFNNISRKLPSQLMAFGTTCVLVGCNLGSSITPYVMKVIGIFSEKMSASFAVYAVLMLILGILMLIHRVLRKNGAARQAF